MQDPASNGRRRALRALATTAAVALTLALASVIAPAGAAAGPSRALVGRVESGGVALAGYRVALFAHYLARGPRWVELGSDSSDASGRFDIRYSLHGGHSREEPLLFVEASRGLVMLATALGSAASLGDRSVAVNERTTVATGTAYAQFVHGARVDGNRYGMTNAAAMATNLANPHTGTAGVVLTSTPNGTETSALPTFNSLTNVVAACVADQRNCAGLFAATAPPGGRPSANVLQAVTNIVKYPSYPVYRHMAGDPLFALSQITPVNTPALTTAPTNWLLFVKFTGGFYSVQDYGNLINGPGNFAIDAKGNVWANDNAVPAPEGTFTCAGRRLLEFSPSGQPMPGTPYQGGGLSGVGYGITLDPQGNVWVGNFGFQDPPCALLPGIAAKHNSLSEFAADGQPISGSNGYTDGNISWPQGTISDRAGNIWVANCGNDTVTEYPHGDPSKAVNIPLGPTPGAHNPQMKPFGLATDAQGNIWAADNRSNTVSVISPDGGLLETLLSSYDGKTVLSHPVGDASDLEGNMWVANSDWLDSPCPTRTKLGSAAHPSITLYREDTHTPYRGSPFTGGGLTLPWGIAVDGDDTVWVFNFGNSPVLPDGSQPTDVPTGISRFCGMTTANCPRHMSVGDPISPDTGYRSDALQRITGAEIDPSGNIWITSNWRLDANPFVNPFGNSIVVAVGAAGPLKTPLIGPPVAFTGNR